MYIFHNHVHGIRSFIIEYHNLDEYIKLKFVSVFHVPVTVTFRVPVTVTVIMTFPRPRHCDCNHDLPTSPSPGPCSTVDILTPGIGLLTLELGLP